MAKPNDYVVYDGPSACNAKGKVGGLLYRFHTHRFRPVAKGSVCSGIGGLL